MGNGWRLLQHVFEEHLSWFVRPDRACWVCPRQFFFTIKCNETFGEAGGKI